MTQEEIDRAVPRDPPMESTPARAPVPAPQPEPVDREPQKERQTDAARAAEAAPAKGDSDVEETVAPTAAAAPKRQGLRVTPDIMITVLQTAMVHRYYEVRFNQLKPPYTGAKVAGSKGTKGTTMAAIRAQLDRDPAFKDRVPRAETLDSWLDDVLRDRLKVTTPPLLTGPCCAVLSITHPLG